MSDLIITIGRENGSGGREVGRIVADMLGVKCYDREIVEATARNAGVSVEEVERSEESRRRSPLYFGGIPSSNPMFEEQSETIRLLLSYHPTGVGIGLTMPSGIPLATCSTVRFFFSRPWS